VCEKFVEEALKWLQKLKNIRKSWEKIFYNTQNKFNPTLCSKYENFKQNQAQDFYMQFYATIKNSRPESCK
jgi:hypothetical protein